MSRTRRATITEIVCPNCGFHHEVEVPRHGKRGEGAWYSRKIKKLNRTHKLALDVLKDRPNGLSLTEAWKNIREWCYTDPVEFGKCPTKQGLSGRLSELAGLGLVRSENNQIRLVDSESQQFRFEKQPRWFLSSQQ